MHSHTVDGQVRYNADGSISVRLHNGHVFTLEGDSIRADLASIQTVGIKHLVEVASHGVNTIAGSRSHVVHFINGGLLQFAYNSAGDLIELQSHNLACELSREGELLFRIHQTLASDETVKM